MVSYTLGYSNNYDISGGSCGSSGRRSDLYTNFMETDISQIPYRTSVEVPFYVTTTSKCLNYVDIELFLGATCESSDTYQYGTITNGGNIDVDYGTTYGMSNSTATFSVSWKSSTSVSAGILPSANTMTSTSSDIPTWAVAVIVLVAVCIIALIMIFIVLWKIMKQNEMTAMKQAKHEGGNLMDIYEDKSDKFREVNDKISSSKGLLSSKSRSYARRLSNSQV